MNAIIALEKFGYVFTLNNGHIHYKLAGVRPNPAVVRPSLEALKSHRDEAAAFLRIRHLPERILLNELYRYAHLLEPGDLKRFYAPE